MNRSMGGQLTGRMGGQGDGVVGVGIRWRDRWKDERRDGWKVGLVKKIEGCTVR